MDKKPQRKKLRLKDYDYNSAGFYFITICTKDRKSYLGSVVGDAAHCVPFVELTHYGEITEKYLLSMGKHNCDIRLHKYCIMPNHVHLLIQIDTGTQWAASPTKNRVSQAIRTLKCLTSKEIGFSIWQRSYYDHIIRNEQDYFHVWEYIDENPTKWAVDEYYS